MCDLIAINEHRASKYLYHVLLGVAHVARTFRLATQAIIPERDLQSEDHYDISVGATIRGEDYI